MSSLDKDRAANVGQLVWRDNCESLKAQAYTVNPIIRYG